MRPTSCLKSERLLTTAKGAWIFFSNGVATRGLSGKKKVIGGKGRGYHGIKMNMKIKTINNLCL